MLGKEFQETFVDIFSTFHMMKTQAVYLCDYKIPYILFYVNPPETLILCKRSMWRCGTGVFWGEGNLAGNGVNYTGSVMKVYSDSYKHLAVHCDMTVYPGEEKEWR